MMPYHAAKKALVIILGLYFLVGIYAEHTADGEMYPIFSWRLFAVVPNEVTTYKIEISALGNETYNPPLKFSESKFIFDEVAQSPTDYEQPILELGSAIENNDDIRIRAYREKIENVFPPDTYQYSVVKVSYDSLEYWHTRSYTVLETLATFQNEDQ